MNEAQKEKLAKVKKFLDDHPEASGRSARDHGRCPHVFRSPPIASRPFDRRASIAARPISPKGSRTVHGGGPGRMTAVYFDSLRHLDLGHIFHNGSPSVAQMGPVCSTPASRVA